MTLIGLPRGELTSETPARLLSRFSWSSEILSLTEHDLASDNDLIYERALLSFSSASRSVFVGGDSSVCYPMTRSFFDWCETDGEEPCLLVFSAHAGLGAPKDRKAPSRESWLRALLLDGFPVQNILLVGVRSWTPDELTFLEETGLRTITLDAFLSDSQEMTDKIMEFCLGRPTYVSWNISIVDPAFAPATLNPEPGGLSSQQALSLCRRLSQMRHLRALDLVEITSSDSSALTFLLGERLLQVFL